MLAALVYSHRDNRTSFQAGRSTGRNSSCTIATHSTARETRKNKAKRKIRII